MTPPLLAKYNYKINAKRTVLTSTSTLCSHSSGTAATALASTHNLGSLVQNYMQHTKILSTWIPVTQVLDLVVVATSFIPAFFILHLEIKQQEQSLEDYIQLSVMMQYRNDD